VTQLDPHICYRALEARDPRFDGRLFVAVITTGIYCRPVCPVSTARFEHCRFFPSAAAAQTAGFRPCLRCRPETTYELGAWRGTSNTVSRALALIAQGALDGDTASVAALAERLGIGERQLRRLFRQHVGASPAAVAYTRRVLFAKQLIHETRLPMTDIAMASGFGSVRRFNELFLALFQRPPSALRKSGQITIASAVAGVTVRLRYRPPYDWPAMLAYLQARAIDGMERVQDGVYARTLWVRGEVGHVAIRHDAARASVLATIRFPHVAVLPAVVACIRAALDLDADITAIGQHLSRDPLLARLVAQRPGLRVPGAWDGFELAVRAILGQQVSVEAGRRLAGQLLSLFEASPLTAADVSSEPSLPRTFPRPEQVTLADLTALKMPNARKRAVLALAEAALADPGLFEPHASLDQTVECFKAIRGIGDWTAHYIALRAVHEPDAFPVADAGLLRSVARMVPLDTVQLSERAEQWRPWRAYAAQHLWAADSAAQVLEPRRTA